MKKLKYIWALFLALSLLAACGSASESITGTWTMQTAYSELSSGGSTETDLGNLADYVSFEDLYLTSTYTFREDKTYTFRPDVEQYIRDCKAVWIDAVNAYYEAQIAERNLDITVEEAWELDGLTVDDLVDSEAIRQAFAELDTEGNYRVQDGKLYLSAGTEYRVDEAVYTVFERSGNTMTFTEAVGSSSSVTFPVTLTRTPE